MKDRAETFGDVASRAAQGGDLAAVLDLLGHGTSPDAPDRHGFTALARAAQYDRLDLTRLLLDAGADPNEPCKWGLTPLMIVKSVDVAEALLAAGAEVNAVTQFNRSGMEPAKTALMKAAQSGRLAIVELLLAHGADIEMRDTEGRSARVTALSHAALRGQEGAVAVLLARGADVNAYDGRGTTALHASLVSTVHGCKVEVVRALLAAGAEVNATTRFSWPTHTGGTALMEAALHGATDCARVLIEHGADLEVSSAIDEDGVGGWTALLAAVANNRLDTTRLLIEHGADVNNGGEGGRLPLTIARSRARRTGNTEIVDLLVTAGADNGGDAA